MNKYMCIHGHFYQPPRENPWLEDIELQDSAHPYHDWNKRITAECYAPNASSRILSDQGRIKKIINNYSKISFNFGPTLLDWIKSKEPDVYSAIIEADKKSRENFSGHGSALAQAYNHMIMPLANSRDKYTQVLWGIRDFENHFGRQPEGMWLPETAVDLETLDIMAGLGISFTILTPYQAKQFRKIGSETWEQVGPRGIDPSMPYKLHLPSSGRSINIFFYDGPISQAVAFEGLLNSGEKFARRMESGFSSDRDWPQLVNIATDGETYGHHHRYGDMALAFALNYIENNELARLTIYGEFLEKHPPSYEVEIWEDTSWSCAHGVGRWYYDCGCNSGMHPDWSQEWRKPLRIALNEVRDAMAPLFEEKAGMFLKDPWQARNDYIQVILDRSPGSVEQFLEKHAARSLNHEEKITVIKLLETQRHAMLMYTSCGWFFDDISGIETVQVIKYAGRAIQLAQELFNDGEIENRFVEKLAEAKGNIDRHPDGKHVYNRFVQPSRVDLFQVGAHYAMSSVFKPYEDKTQIFCYDIHRHDYHKLARGNLKISLGRAKITSVITMESTIVTFAALKPDNHNLNAGVRVFKNEQKYEELVKNINNAFDQDDLTSLNHLLNRYFEGIVYSLKQLFKDEQRKITSLMLDSTLWELEDSLRDIYQRYLPLMRFLNKLDSPQPKPLQLTVQFIINTDLQRAFSESSTNFKKVKSLLNDAENWDIPLDEKELGFTVKENLEKKARRWQEGPTDISSLQNLIDTVELAHSLPFDVNLWKVQNIYYRIFNTVYPEIRQRAEQGDENAGDWLQNFVSLGEKLHMQLSDDILPGPEAELAAARAR